MGAPSSLCNVAMFSLGRVLKEQRMMEKYVSNLGTACLQCCGEKGSNSFFQPVTDKGVSNVVIRCSGSINLLAFLSFLEKYIDDKETAEDFFRVKGVLDVAGSNSKYVLQSVHKVRVMGFCGPWGDCLRASRMIFIGRGMKARRVALTREFMSCIAKPLRF